MTHPQNLPPAPGWPIHPALIAIGFEIPGFQIKRPIALVRGLIVRSPGIAGGFAASFEALGGGNVNTLIQVCEKARQDALMQLMQHAVQHGANAVIGLRYDATELGQGMTEVLAYGNAVWVEPS